MSEEEFDFKDTLLLPNTAFPMRASLPKREPEWIKHSMEDWSTHPSRA